MFVARVKAGKKAELEEAGSPASRRRIVLAAAEIG